MAVGLAALWLRKAAQGNMTGLNVTKPSVPLFEIFESNPVSWSNYREFATNTLVIERLTMDNVHKSFIFHSLE